MPIVLVELPAAAAADSNAPALIAACSAGLRRGTCVTEEPASGERAAAVAIVAWLDSDHLRARIDVGRRAEQRAGWQVRELTFREQDAPLERWRSVGLAIAGVVGEATLLEPAKPVTVKSTKRELPASRARPPAPSSWRVALGPVFEHSLSTEPPSAGAWFDISRRLSSSLPLELSALASRSWSLAVTSGVNTSFSTLGLGFRGSAAVGEFSLRGRFWQLSRR